MAEIKEQQGDNACFLLSYLPCNSFHYHICNWFVLAYEPEQGCKPAEKTNQGKKFSGQLCS